MKIEEVWRLWSDYDPCFHSSYLEWPPEEVMEDVLDFVTPLYLDLPMADDIMHGLHVLCEKNCGFVRLKPIELNKLYEGQISDAFMSIDGDELHLSSPEGRDIIVPENGIVTLSWRRSEWSRRGTVFDFDQKHFSLKVIPIVLCGRARGELKDWGDAGHFGRLTRRENGFEIVRV
jgi:hypothetical protein